jgi:prolyl-tRNA editing enzyme YbaK/EbsC (Cys-tRNA(Pro) deacylase)
VVRTFKVNEVKLVTFKLAETNSGQPSGGTASIGHRTKMRSIVDSALMNYETVYSGGGTRNRLLELRIKDIVRTNGSVLAEISI